jgi:hypothetical protein
MRSIGRLASEADFLRESPLTGVALDLRRDKSSPREAAL